MKDRLRIPPVFIAFAAVGLAACAADPPDDRNGNGNGTGGASTGSGGAGSGGNAGGSGGKSGAGGSGPACMGDNGALPRLHVDGNLIKDTCGNTVILRGSSLIDLGTIIAYDGADGIGNRIDKLISTGLAGHVVRFPVYPRTNVNQTYPYYSPLPFPVGPAAPASSSTKARDVSVEDYVAMVLRPAVDYAAKKGLYAIIDYHQIDDTSDKTNTSAADATTFWTAIAPLFKDDANVLYEAFNEPIDQSLGSSSSARWEAYKPHAQTWVDTIRAGAPDTIIIVGSPMWSQNLGGAAASPITGTNLVYTAHVYPGNWNGGFMTDFQTCAAVHPVFVTEWGYNTTGTDKNLKAPTATWGSDFQKYVDSKGASWIAWVADKDWAPPLYNTDGTTLSDFGTLVKGWLGN